MSKAAILIAAIAAALPVAALAHPGDHSALSAQAGLSHLLSAPDHVLEMSMLTALTAGAGVGWRRVAQQVKA